MDRCTEWIGLQLIYGEMLAICENLFCAAGYTFMPVKGAYLICTGLASSIPDRKMVDIDLLIPEDQFDEICGWFSQLPGVVCKDNYWEFERSFVYTIWGNVITLEFHRLINFPARFSLPNKMLFDRGVKINDSCILPDPTDALLIHICHKLAHVIDGFEEQFYKEISMYASQEGFSWNVFWERAEKTGIMGFVWLVAERWKKTMNEEMVLPDAPDLYSKILAQYNLFMRGRFPYIRRLFFEVPFVRDVFKLIKNKIQL